MSNSQILLSYIGRGSKCAMNDYLPKHIASFSWYRLFWFYLQVYSKNRSFCPISSTYMKIEFSNGNIGKIGVSI